MALGDPAAQKSLPGSRALPGLGTRWRVLEGVSLERRGKEEAPDLNRGNSAPGGVTGTHAHQADTLCTDQHAQTYPHTLRRVHTQTTLPPQPRPPPPRPRVATAPLASPSRRPQTPGLTQPHHHRPGSTGAKRAARPAANEVWRASEQFTSAQLLKTAALGNDRLGGDPRVG